MSSIPYIVAEPCLPNILSFTSEPEPELRLILTLVGTEIPLTISKEDYRLFMPTNAFTINELPSGHEIKTIFVDICHRCGPPLRLDCNHAERFLTLQPGIPHEVYSLGFRPLGLERTGNKWTARPEEPGDDKYRTYKFLRFGMHLLESGKEYRIRVRQDVEIGVWRWGGKEVLMPCDWHTSDGAPLKVLSSEGIKVQVEE